MDSSSIAQLLQTTRRARRPIHRTQAGTPVLLNADHCLLEAFFFLLALFCTRGRDLGSRFLWIDIAVLLWLSDQVAWLLCPDSLRHRFGELIAEWVWLDHCGGVSDLQTALPG
jgi:hypothetical protein